MRRGSHCLRGPQPASPGMESKLSLCHSILMAAMGSLLHLLGPGSEWHHATRRRQDCHVFMVSCVRCCRGMLFHSELLPVASWFLVFKSYTQEKAKRLRMCEPGGSQVTLTGIPGRMMSEYLLREPKGF